MAYDRRQSYQGPSPRNRGRWRQPGYGQNKRGLNTKVHLAVDANGMPVRIVITTGTTADCKQAVRLIDGFAAQYLLADRGYDTNELIESAVRSGMQVVIPPKKYQKKQINPDQNLMRERKCDKMAIITPNFNFAGRCEEAINLYQKAFNARVGCLLRYSDANKSDWDMKLAPEQERYIYHAELFIGNQRIMMCDNMDVSLAKSTALSLTVTFDTMGEVKQAYEVLRRNSETIYPMQSTTYSSCMVVFVDNFGFRWGLMTEQTDR